MGGHLTRRVRIITGRKRQVSLLSYHGTWSPCIVEWLFDAVWYGVLQDTGSGARIAQATIRTEAQTRAHLHALLGYASISHSIMTIMSFPHKYVHSSMNEYCLVEQLCNHWSCSIQGNIPLPVLLTESTTVSHRLSSEKTSQAPFPQLQHRSGDINRRTFRWSRPGGITKGRHDVDMSPTWNWNPFAPSSRVSPTIFS